MKGGTEQNGKEKRQEGRKEGREEGRKEGRKKKRLLCKKDQVDVSKNQIENLNIETIILNHPKAVVFVTLPFA